MSNWLRSIYKLVSVDMQACFESHLVAFGRLDHSFTKGATLGVYRSVLFHNLKIFCFVGAMLDLVHDV